MLSATGMHFCSSVCLNAMLLSDESSDTSFQAIWLVLTLYPRLSHSGGAALCRLNVVRAIVLMHQNRVIS